MSMRKIISDAIASHLEWTETFKRSIASGKVSEKARIAGYDDLCEFGKWLYSLDDAVKHLPAYRKVKDLHYQFHATAGQIVTLMNSAAFAEATLLLGGGYAVVSAQLLQALREWQALEAE